MAYVPVTYIPDGPVTVALKKSVKRQRPKPKLGNLGPLLDENLVAARKHGHFLYHPDDLRLLSGVRENPLVVDQGFDVLRSVMADKGVAEPDRWQRTAPYYQNVPLTLSRTAMLAVAMAIAITLAVLLGHERHLTAMVVAIVAVSVLGAGGMALIVSRSVIRVQRHPGAVSSGLMSRFPMSDPSRG